MDTGKEKTLLSFKNVSKFFRQASGDTLWALRSVDIEVEEGTSVAIMGRSGSGKSTFLHLAAGIDIPSEGEVRFLGRNVAELSERERTRERRERIGLVFQFFHLVPHMSVWENVILPAWIAGDERRRSEHRVRELLGRVGLENRARDPAQMLSGGEMQRVALCRALLRHPQLMLADEPTGNLDDENSKLVMDLLIRLVQEEGSTLIYVTHSSELAARADEVWHLHSGILEQS